MKDVDYCRAKHLFHTINKSLVRSHFLFVGCFPPLSPHLLISSTLVIHLNCKCNAWWDILGCYGHLCTKHWINNATKRISWRITSSLKYKYDPYTTLFYEITAKRCFKMMPLIYWKIDMWQCCIPTPHNKPLHTEGSSHYVLDVLKYC